MKEKIKKYWFKVTLIVLLLGILTALKHQDPTTLAVIKWIVGALVDIVKIVVAFINDIIDTGKQFLELFHK